MSGIRTLDQFQTAMDKELSWRIKEIGAFSVASKQNGAASKYFIPVSLSSD
jgi:hypothetical protein